jgi:hypothetical protein
MIDITRKPLESGHKAFDRVANRDGGDLYTGNASTGVQVSAYVRARTDTECNGFSRPEGELREWDLKNYFPRIPSGIRQRVLELTEKEPVILYWIFHFARGVLREHGYLATRTEARNHALARIWCTGGPKSYRILEETSRYLSNAEDYRSVSPKEYLELPESAREGWRYFIECAGEPFHGKELLGLRAYAGNWALPLEELDNFYLTGNNRLIAFFPDGSRSGIHFGARLRVVEKNGEKTMASNDQRTRAGQGGFHV